MTNEQIAKDWRRDVVSALPWQRATNQNDLSNGVLRGYAVTAPGLPRRGFLKPGLRLPEADGKCWAAREKIAADLAHELGLPVPPAILWRQADRLPHVEPHVVITLIGHPNLIEWTRVRYLGARPPGTNEPDARKAFAACSGVLAFDTWLDQHEHARQHAGNLVWGYGSADEAQITFLDYASALGADGSWESGGWRSVVVPAFDPFLLAALDRVWLRRTVDAIELVSDERIKEIVARIPEDFLPPSEKDMLQKALTGRRGLVRETLERYRRAEEIS